MFFRVFSPSFYYLHVIIKRSVAELHLLNYMLSKYSSEYLKTDASEVWKLFFETHLILNIQTTFTLQKAHWKNFWWNYNKNESCKPYLGNKEQKLLFLVVSQLDLHIEFDFARPFFFFFFLACPIGRIEVNFSSPVFCNITTLKWSK